MALKHALTMVVPPTLALAQLAIIVLLGCLVLKIVPRLAEEAMLVMPILLAKPAILQASRLPVMVIRVICNQALLQYAYSLQSCQPQQLDVTPARLGTAAKLF